MGVVDASCPLPHGLGNRVLEGSRASGNRHHLCPQKPHPVHVQRLPLRVLFPHEHHALHAHEGGGGGRGDPMLARAGLGDEPGLAHLLGKQSLTQHVVYLVGAGVVQILPLEVDFRPAQVLRQLFGEGQPGGPARVLVQQLRQLPVEARVVLIKVIGSFQLNHGVHQSFRDVLPAVDAKASF